MIYTTSIAACQRIYGAVCGKRVSRDGTLERSDRQKLGPFRSIVLPTGILLSKQTNNFIFKAPLVTHIVFNFDVIFMTTNYVFISVLYLLLNDTSTLGWVTIYKHLRKLCKHRERIAFC